MAISYDDYRKKYKDSIQDIRVNLSKQTENNIVSNEPSSGYGVNLPKINTTNYKSALIDQQKKESTAKSKSDKLAKSLNVDTKYIGDENAPTRSTAMAQEMNTPKWATPASQNKISTGSVAVETNKKIENTLENQNKFYKSNEYQNYLTEKYTTPLYQYYVDKEKAEKTNDLNWFQKTYTSLFSGLEGNATVFRTPYKTKNKNGETVKVVLPTYNQLETQDTLSNSDSKIGKIYYEAVQSVGQMMPNIALSFIPFVGQGLSLAQLGVSAFANSYNQNLLEGKKKSTSASKALLSSGIEVATEKMFGGMGKIFGKGALDEVVIKKISSKVNNRVLKGLAELGLSSVGEGIEEVVGSVADRAISKYLYKEDVPSLSEWGEEVLEEFLVAQVSSIMLGSLTTVNDTKARINTDNYVINQIQQETNKTLTEVEKNNVRKQIDNFYNEGITDNNVISYAIQNGITDATTLRTMEYNNIQQDIDNQTTQLNELQNQLLALQEKSATNLPGNNNQETKSTISKLNKDINSLNEMISAEKIVQSELKNYAQNNVLPSQTLSNNEDPFNIYSAGIQNAQNNGIAITDSLEEILKASAVRGVNVTFDNNLDSNSNGVWKEIKNNDGTITRTITFNPNTVNRYSASEVFVHELFHDISATSEGQTIIKQVINYLGTNSALKEEYLKQRALLEAEYVKLTDVNGNLLYDPNSSKFKSKIDEEVTASVLAKKLGNKEFINQLVQQKPSLARRIYNWVVNLVNKLKGKNTQEYQFWNNVKKNFEEAFNSEYVQSQNGSEKYSAVGIKGINNLNENNKTEKVIKQNFVNSYNEAINKYNNGESIDNIYKDTYWYIDEKTGDWKVEIPDNMMTIKTNLQLKEGVKYKLSDVIDNPLLFSMYPEFKNYEFVFKDFGEDKTLIKFIRKIFKNNTIHKGSFNSNEHKFTINKKLINNKTSLKNTIVHEIQHAIQNYEGFETGSNTLLSKEKYYKSRGEAEARTAASRRELSLEQRRSGKAPYVQQEENLNRTYNRYLSKRGIFDKVKDAIYNKIERWSNIAKEEGYSFEEISEENTKKNKQYNDRLRTSNSSFNLPKVTSNLNEYIEDVSSRQAKQRIADKEAVKQSILDYLEENNITKPTKDDMMNAFGWYNEYDNANEFEDISKAEKLYSEVADELLDKDNKIQGLDNYTKSDVEDMVYDHFEKTMDEYGFDIDDIQGVYLHGSRLRGTARSDSDMDAVVFYIGNESEDYIFNTINDDNNQLVVDGIKVDINPVSVDSMSEIDDYIARSEAYDKEVLSKESEKDFFSLKQKQNDIIQNSNPVNDDYHTWIRNANDIKTLQETLQDSDWSEYDEFNPDLTRKDIENAIDKGTIMVYSSYPIENGVFVSPSRMEAESYSSDGNVYSQEVNINDVAWIDPTQGQYAKVNDNTKFSRNVDNWDNYVNENISSEGTKTKFEKILPKAKVSLPVEKKTTSNGNNNTQRVTKLQALTDTVPMEQKAIDMLSRNIKKSLSLNNDETSEFKQVLYEISQNPNITKDEIREIVDRRFSEKNIKTKIEDVIKIKSELRNYPINVSSFVKSDIADYNRFRQENFGKINFSKNGSPVDSTYQELNEMYPSYFPSSINNETDQLKQIAYVANMDSFVDETAYLPDEVIDDATDWIYDSIQDYKLTQKVKNNEISYKEYTKALNGENLLSRDEVRSALLSEMGITEEDIAKGKDISAIDLSRTDPIRVNEKVFGYETGKKINDATINQTKHNEAEKNRWLNKERAEIKVLGIKARSKESAAVQKYGEKQYVTDKGEVVKYGDRELASEFPDIEIQNKIKNAAKVIREKYDTYIDQINESLNEMGYKPIKKRDDYMRHFQALNDVFSRFGVPFNAESMSADSLPTDINGLTDQFKPGKQYFANAMKRMGIRTEYDAITGIDGYLDGASDLIYHTADIQRYRTLSKLIRDTYGAEHGYDNKENMSDEEFAKRVEDIQSNKLAKYAAWLDEQANALANKKGKIDRGVEELFGRKIYNILNTAKKQVGSNMTGFNVRSALTNFASAVQGASKTNKLAFVKGTISTINNIVHNDGLIDKSDFLTNRFGSDNLSKKRWQKLSDAGQIFMTGTDYFTANQIWRGKYFENLQKGMNEADAIKSADDFAARIMGDRSKGSTATMFNSKTLGFFTQFQLEVNNQWSSLIHDNKIDIQSGNKTGASVLFQMGQLFGLSYLFNNLMKSLTGTDVMIDPIDLLKKIFDPDDDDKDKNMSERAFDAVGDVINDLPFVSVFTGGRIPMSEAFTGVSTLAKKLTGQTDSYGNEIKWNDVKSDIIESSYYWILPTGYGQLRKTAKGLGMYNKNLPVAGSYTDSGNLRFTADESTSGKIKSVLFGAYNGKEAQKYINSGYKTISASRIQEMKDLDMTSSEYVKYRSGLTNAGTKNAEKIDYIANSKYSDKQKNIMANNLLERTDFNIKEYKKYGSYDEYQYARDYPEKYSVISQITAYDKYLKYKDEITEIRNNTSNDKEETILYINSLNLSIPQKAIFIKQYYKSFTQYDRQIIEYINSKSYTRQEKETILTNMGFTINNGRVVY